MRDVPGLTICWKLHGAHWYRRITLEASDSVMQGDANNFSSAPQDKLPAFLLTLWVLFGLLAGSFYGHPLLLTVLSLQTPRHSTPGDNRHALCL